MEQYASGNPFFTVNAFGGAGDKLHIHIQPKMMHGYSCVPVFPESKRCFNEAVRMLNEV